MEPIAEPVYLRNPFLISERLGRDEELEQSFVLQGILPDSFRENLRQTGFPTGSNVPVNALFAESMTNRLAAGFAPTPDEIALYHSPTMPFISKGNVDLLLEDKRQRGELSETGFERIRQQLNDPGQIASVQKAYNFGPLGEQYRSARVDDYLNGTLSDEGVRQFNYEVKTNPLLAEELQNRQQGQATENEQVSQPPVPEQSVNPAAKAEVVFPPGARADLPEEKATQLVQADAVDAEPGKVQPVQADAIQAEPEKVDPVGENLTQDQPATRTPVDEPVVNPIQKPSSMAPPVEEVPRRAGIPEEIPAHQPGQAIPRAEQQEGESTEKRGFFAQIGSFLSRVVQSVREFFTPAAPAQRPIVQLPRQPSQQPQPTNRANSTAASTGNGQNQQAAQNQQRMQTAQASQNQPVAGQSTQQAAQTGQGVRSEPSPQIQQAIPQAALDIGQAAQQLPNVQSQPTPQGQQQAATARVEPVAPQQAPSLNLVQRVVTYVQKQVKRAVDFVGDQWSRLTRRSGQSGGDQARTVVEDGRAQSDGEKRTSPENADEKTKRVNQVNQTTLETTRQVGLEPAPAQQQSPTSKVGTPAVSQPQSQAPQKEASPGGLEASPSAALQGQPNLTPTAMNSLDTTAFMTRVQLMSPPERSYLYGEMGMGKLNPMETSVMNRLVVADPLIREEFRDFSIRQAEYGKFLDGKMGVEEQQGFMQRISSSPALKKELDTASEHRQNVDMDRYLKGTMPPDELLRFEQKIENDPGLQYKLKQHQTVQEDAARQQVQRVPSTQQPQPRQQQPTGVKGGLRPEERIVGGLLEGLLVQEKGNTKRVADLLKSLTPQTRQEMAQKLARPDASAGSILSELNKVHDRMNAFGGPTNVFRELGKRQDLSIQPDRRQKMEEGLKQENKKSWLDADELRSGKVQRLDEKKQMEREAAFEKMKPARKMTQGV